MKTEGCILSRTARGRLRMLFPSGPTSFGGKEAALRDPRTKIGSKLPRNCARIRIYKMLTCQPNPALFDTDSFIAPQRFHCQCGTPIFFRNSRCVSCGAALGYEPHLQRLFTLEAE